MPQTAGAPAEDTEVVRANVDKAFAAAAGVAAVEPLGAKERALAAMPYLFSRPRKGL